MNKGRNTRREEEGEEDHSRAKTGICLGRAEDCLSSSPLATQSRNAVTPKSLLVQYTLHNHSRSLPIFPLRSILLNRSWSSCLHPALSTNPVAQRRRRHAHLRQTHRVAAQRACWAWPAPFEVGSESVRGVRRQAARRRCVGVGGVGEAQQRSVAFARGAMLAHRARTSDHEILLHAHTPTLPGASRLSRPFLSLTCGAAAAPFGRAAAAVAAAAAAAAAARAPLTGAAPFAAAAAVSFVPSSSSTRRYSTNNSSSSGSSSSSGMTMTSPTTTTAATAGAAPAASAWSGERRSFWTVVGFSQAAHVRRRRRRRRRAPPLAHLIATHTTHA